MGVTSEGRAYLDPIQFLPLSLIFAKAILLPVVLDALQCLIVYQAGIGINHTQKMLNQSFLSVMGEEEQEGLERGKS